MAAYQRFELTRAPGGPQLTPDRPQLVESVTAVALGLHFHPSIRAQNTLRTQPLSDPRSRARREMQAWLPNFFEAHPQ